MYLISRYLNKFEYSKFEYKFEYPWIRVIVRALVESILMLLYMWYTIYIYHGTCIHMCAHTNKHAEKQNGRRNEGIRETRNTNSHVLHNKYSEHVCFFWLGYLVGYRRIKTRLKKKKEKNKKGIRGICKTKAARGGGCLYHSRRSESVLLIN